MAQHHQYQPLYHIQIQLVDHFHPGQAQHNAFATQPVQSDPWSGHAPSRSSMIPRTGSVIFNSASNPDSTSGGQYQDQSNLQTWAQSFTDPTSLIGPSDHRVENFYNPATHKVVQQTMPRRPQINIPPSHTLNTSPIEAQWAQTEPSPDQQGFVSYDASSSLFTDSYTVDQSPDFPHSPYQQAVNLSAVGHGSSSGVFSFYSDQAMMLDPSPVQQHILQPPHTNIAIQTDYTPIKNESTFDAMLEPESATFARDLAKNGGRALGTHLDLATASTDLPSPDINATPSSRKEPTMHLNQWSSLVPEEENQRIGPTFAAAIAIPLPSDLSSQSVDANGDGLDEVDELLKEWTTVF
jgi:hypothetical protein